MTLDKNDPLYKQGLEHGLTEEQVEAILRYSGRDGLEAVLARKKKTENSDDGWQPEVVVETIGIENGPGQDAGQNPGCISVLLTFFIFIILMGAWEALYTGPPNPVIQFAVFFMLFGVAVGIAMFIWKYLGKYWDYGWALFKKNWWKALGVLWVISIILQLIFGIPAKDQKDDGYPPMPEAATNTSPDMPAQP